MTDYKKELSELISSIKIGLEIAGYAIFAFLCFFWYQTGFLTHAIKISTIIFCTIGLLTILGKVYSGIFSIIAIAFYIFFPIHWYIYTPLLISFSLLYLISLAELEDYIHSILQKIEYLKNIVMLKNQITISKNYSSLNGSNTDDFFASPLPIYLSPPLHDKIILDDHPTTVTIKNTYLIWKSPIKKKEKIISRYKLISEQMKKLKINLSTIALKEVRQESKKYLFIFHHDIIRISYDMQIEATEEEIRRYGYIVKDRKEYSRLIDDLIINIVKTLEGTAELQYLIKKVRE